MKCLDCGYNIMQDEVDEHKGHETTFGFFTENTIEEKLYALVEGLNKLSAKGISLSIKQETDYSRGITDGMSNAYRLCSLWIERILKSNIKKGNNNGSFTK